MKPGEYVEYRQTNTKFYPSLVVPEGITKTWHDWVRVIVVQEVEDGSFLVFGRKNSRQSEDKVFRARVDELRPVETTETEV